LFISSGKAAQNKSQPFLRRYLVQGEGTLLDAALLDITIPGAPMLVHAQSSTKASVPSTLLSFNFSIYERQELVIVADASRDNIEEAWR